MLEEHLLQACGLCNDLYNELDRVYQPLNSEWKKISSKKKRLQQIMSWYDHEDEDDEDDDN
jgi:hypothetical protein